MVIYGFDAGHSNNDSKIGHQYGGCHGNQATQKYRKMINIVHLSCIGYCINLTYIDFYKPVLG